MRSGSRHTATNSTENNDINPGGKHQSGTLKVDSGNGHRQTNVRKRGMKSIAGIHLYHTRQQPLPSQENVMKLKSTNNI